MTQNKFSKQGYAALTMTLLTMIVSLSVIGGLAFLSLKEVSVNKVFRKSVESYYISEGGVEDAVYRIITGKQIDIQETLGVGSGTTTIFVTSVGNQRIIRSEGKKETFQQNLESRVDLSVSGANFFYGAQAGDGGIIMENNSIVSGSIYSNGNITGQNSPTITGDAFAAATSIIDDMTINANAQAHSITNSTVGAYASSTNLIDDVVTGKDAHAYELRRSSIGKDAYYQVIDKSTVVTGTKFPGSTPPVDLPKLPMPISDELLDQWETDAEAGGTISGPCPYKPANGSTLGPVKILCDVIIDGTAVVTVTGNIWVVGDLTLKNSAILQLSSAYGETSGVVITDDPINRSSKGLVSIQNSSQILGSGTARSYIMIASRNNSMESGGTAVAIDVKNSSSASLYYAPHGKISISNNVNLKEVTAYGIELKNSGTLTYESGLQDVNFSSGPSGGYDVKYWKEVE